MRAKRVCKRTSAALLISMLVLALFASYILPSEAMAADDGFVIENGVLKSYTGNASTVNVPDGVTTIGDGSGKVFPDTVTSVTFPDSVIGIAKGAFEKSPIKTMTLPENLQSIGENAFLSSKITYLKFPDSVRSVGKNAFLNASSMTSVDLNDGLETIGDYAFSVSRVSGISIPASVKTIGQGAFDYEYGGDMYIVINGSETQFGKDALPYYYAVDVYAPAGSTAATFVNRMKEEEGDRCKLAFHALDEFVPAASIALNKETASLHRKETLQLSVMCSPQNARMPNCGWTSSSEKVAKVSSKGLVTAVDVGRTVITARVGSLTASCTIQVVKDEGESDFYIDSQGCITGYKGTVPSRLEIPETVDGVSVTGIADQAFKGAEGITEAVLPDSLTTIGAQAFSGCSSLGKINLSGVTSLGKECLRGTAVQKIVLAEGLKEIPEAAFQSCSSLSRVVLPDSLVAIGSRAFSSCGSLQRIALNEGLKTIGKEAFYRVPLITLHLPSTFENMGEKYMGDVFEDPGKAYAETTMKNITVDGENPLFSSYDGILYSKDGTTVVFCPRGRTSASIAEGVDKIGDYAFFMCPALTQVKMPSTLKTVGIGAFQYDEALTACELPEGLETVGHSAFFGAENWDGVDRIPSSVRTIEDYGFAECKGSRIVVPEGVKKIGDFAFWGYEEGLQEIHLPNSLTEIGNSAFGWAKDVKELDIPEGVRSIGNEAFARMDALQKLTLPSTLCHVGKNAFMGKEGANLLSEVVVPNALAELGETAFKNREDTVFYVDRVTNAAAEALKAQNYTVSARRSMQRAVISGLKTKTYSGTAKTQNIAVSLNKTRLAPTDYTVSYKNNRNVGTASVTITGKGKYTGHVTRTFTIRPKGTKITQLKTGRHTMRLRWAAQKTQVDGYQIQYSKSRKFSGERKTIKLSAGTTVKKIKKLKTGSYYVKVRTYKKVSGKTYYSVWSSARKAAVK